MESEQTLAQPDRQVFLREGTVVPWVPHKRNTQFREATLVSIDIDELKEQDGIPVQFHIGISVLHTQDLHDQCYSPLLCADS